MPGRRVRYPMRRDVADIRIGPCDDVGGLVWFVDTSRATGGAVAGPQVGAFDEKKGREDGHKESVEEGGEVRTSVKTPLIILSALALLAGCKSTQKDSFLRTYDEGVLFVQWTREGMQIRGTLEILEKKPDNEIKTTLIALDGTSDGENVSMNLKSSWTVQGGNKAIKGEITGLLKGDTLTLFLAKELEPVQFRRATRTEHDDATRTLQMRANLNKGAH
jgi:hypothetical protein